MKEGGLMIVKISGRGEFGEKEGGVLRDES
jgi:hypothetical protein